MISVKSYMTIGVMQTVVPSLTTKYVLEAMTAPEIETQSSLQYRWNFKQALLLER